MRPPRPAAQAGVALLSAVLIVALATATAVAMVYAGQIAAARTANLLDADQAYLHALAGEGWAARVLARDRVESETDHGGEAWARPMPAAVAADARIEASIEDMQARFNLNNLVQDGRASGPDEARLGRLLAGLGAAPGLAAPVVDWLDADTVPRPGRGAEDAVYQGRRPAHRAANRPMIGTSELRLLPGFSAALVDALRPYVAALPEPTPVNVNTAPAPVLEALIEGLGADGARALVRARGPAGHASVADFLAQPALRGKAVAPSALAVSSRYFRVVASAGHGRASVRLVSLLRRDSQGRVEVLTRSRGED